MNKERNAMQPPRNGTVPNPDPTERTVDQLRREISSLSDIFEAKLQSLIGRLNTSEDNLISKFADAESSRNDALNKAAKTIQDGLDKAERQLQVSLGTAQADLRMNLTDAEKRVNEKFDSKDKSINEKVMQLQELYSEKFQSIQTQFLERDKRTEQLSLADKTAIAAALQAQKEAAGAQNESNTTAQTKMESNFAKLIEQGRELSLTMKENTDTQINDIKSRLDKGEGTSKGADRSDDRTSTVIGLVITGAVSFVVIMGGIIGLITFVVTR